MSPEEAPLEGDYQFSKDFLEQEAQLGGSSVYRGFIFDALFNGDIHAALAYYHRSQEKGSQIDIKETLRSVLRSLITRPEPLSTPGMEWGGMVEEEERAFDPNTIDVDGMYAFIANANIDFHIEHEYQRLMEESLVQGGFLYGEKGARGYDKLEAFARERDIPLDFATPEVAYALQENLEKVCLGNLSRNLEYRPANPISVDDVVRNAQQVIAFAQEKGINLDAKLAFDGARNELSRLKDRPGYEATTKQLREIAEKIGISLE